MRFIQYDRWGAYIRDLRPLGSVTRTRDLEGTDQIELTVATDATKGDRVVCVDSMGRVREWEVASLDETRESGRPALTLYGNDAVGELAGAWLDEKVNDEYTAAECLAKALDGTRWSVGEVDGSDTADSSWYHESVSDALQDICDTYGLELETSYELDDTGTRIAARRVNLYAQRGSDNGKRFAYGKDLTGIRRTVSSDRVITRCYGYGKGVELYDEETGEATGGYSRKVTFADVNDGLEYVDASDEVLAEWGTYDADGNVCHVCGVYENGDCEDADQLLAETTAYLATACEPTVSYEATVAALGAGGMDAEGVDIGDTVQIIDTSFTTPLRLSGRVTKLVEDLTGSSADTKVTLGSIVESYTSRQQAVAQTLATVLSNASAWSSAAAGGVVYISDLIERINAIMNATGGYAYLVEGEGIYVYDQPRDTDPTQCIHIGGGFWRCANAKTSDGDWDWQTMADGGGIYADTLYTGVLSDAAGLNSWNLDTGELSMIKLTEVADALDDEVELRESWISITGAGITLGSSDSETSVNLTTEQLSFVGKGNEVVAYVNGSKLYESNVQVTQSLQIGDGWAFYPRANGNLTLRRVE